MQQRSCLAMRFILCILVACQQLATSSKVVLVTFSSGQELRLQLLTNLLLSAAVHSPSLLQNVKIVCLDSNACAWCRGQLESQLSHHIRILGQRIRELNEKLCQPLCREIKFTESTCICRDFNLTKTTGFPKLDEQLKFQTRLRKDPLYSDRLWYHSVQQKARIADEILNNHSFVVFSDADCAFNGSFDNVHWEYDEEQGAKSGYIIYRCHFTASIICCDIVR